MKKKTKVLLVKSDVRPMEKLLNEGWTAQNAFPHPQGVVFILTK